MYQPTRSLRWAGNKIKTIVTVFLFSRCSFVTPAFTHPHVATFLGEQDIPFEMCLDVQLNGLEITATVGGDGEPFNSSRVAHSLLLAVDDHTNSSLSDDRSSVTSLAGWVENRVSSKVSHAEINLTVLLPTTTSLENKQTRTSTASNSP
jgi:hypothetical protein